MLRQQQELVLAVQQLARAIDSRVLYYLCPSLGTGAHSAPNNGEPAGRSARPRGVRRIRARGKEGEGLGGRAWGMDTSGACMTLSIYRLHEGHAVSSNPSQVPPGGATPQPQMLPAYALRSAPLIGSTPSSVTVSPLLAAGAVGSSSLTTL